jgi:hypothetical protein
MADTVEDRTSAAGTALLTLAAGQFLMTLDRSNVGKTHPWV